jgi:hypothetical protein
MRDLVILFVHAITSFAQLPVPGGIRFVIAVAVLTKHQLPILIRSRQWSHKSRTSNRVVTGLFTLFIRPDCLIRGRNLNHDSPNGLPTRQPVAREIHNLQTSTQPASIFSYLEYTRFIPVPWLPPGRRTHHKEPDVCATQPYFLGQVAGLSMLGFATSIALAVGDMTNSDQQTPAVWLKLLVLECIQESTAGVRIMFQTG